MLAALVVGMSAAAAGIINPPLQPLSPALLAAAKIHGTGCVWQRTARGPILLAMSDDHAVVRGGDKTIVLLPTPDAHDLFPFTFDRWQADGLTVTIKVALRLTRENDDRLTGPAIVTVKRDAGSQRLTGVVSCGT
jgi:hypothetical protein